MRQDRKTHAAAPLRGILAGAVAALALAAPAAALERVTLGSASPWLPYFSALQFGLKLGFFAEEGLEPDFVAVQGSSVLIPQLANKAIDFGWPNADLPVIALDKGEPMPIRFFYNAYTSQVFEFVVLEDSPVQALADLKGGKIGVGALGWGNLPMSRAMLANQGVTWLEDVEVLPVGLGPQAWNRLISGEIDALNLFVHQHEQIALSGTPIRRIPMEERFATIFSNGWATHVDMIEQRPELVAAMGRILAKSLVACSANVEACVRAYWEWDPASRPAPADEAEWIRTNIALNEADMRIQTAGVTDMNRLGEYSVESWQNFVQALYEGEQIGSAELDVSTLFTNDFIDAINDFDRDAVRALAEAVE